MYETGVVTPCAINSQCISGLMMFIKEMHSVFSSVDIIWANIILPVKL